MSAGVSLFGCTDAQFASMESAYDDRRLADHLDDLDGDIPDETPEEAAAQAWLDEVWGGDAA